ncbi:MAG: FIST N-terminal domain-containing protein [Pseudomonadota bacterium]|nr:FIST N-terminal domain-containing protein [Pseudomonadota bacterium]
MKLSQNIIYNGNWESPLDPSLDSKNTVSFVFFHPDANLSNVVKEIKKILPNSHIVGCSGAGEIANNSLVDQKIIVTTAVFEKSQINSFSFKITNVSDCFKTGQQIAVAARGKNLRGICVFSKGIEVNGSELMSGIRSQIEPGVLISGGLAGDGTRFQSTQVLHDQICSQDLVSVVAFYGESLVMTAHAMGGWIPFGIERKVTSSKGNILYALDDIPALELYKEFLGEGAKKLPASALYFPLLLISKNLSGQKNIHNLVRTILAVDDKNQSMTFAGDIPEGENVRFMRSTEKSLLEAASLCAQACRDDLAKDSPILSIMVSCVGRRIVLGSSTQDEVQRIFELLPKQSLQTGFYSYGELAPGESNIGDLHNQTVTLTWIQEKKAA